jgi:hypothetical protein
LNRYDDFPPLRGILAFFSAEERASKIIENIF